MDLTGKVAVITGAASGIGKSIAKLLAEAGAVSVVLDIDRAGGRRAEKEIRSMEGESCFFHCDVSSSADCQKVVKQIVDEFGRIDILVNNAGLIFRRDSVDLDESEWDKTLNVGLKGIFLLSQQVIPQMLVQNTGGSIINIGSGWSLKGGPKAVSYCAAKGGVLNMTRAMAIDHGQQNIRVNCVCPGDIDTPLLQSEAQQLGLDYKVYLKEAAERPLPRVGTPEDVAKAVLFFASDLSSWVTGAHLVVDGGGIA
jgi:NAD(P)-dependent dehydrogenase (short-subunit alcohol dehydrogenase family)